MIMKFISIKEALQKEKGEVALHGWIYRERKLKDKIFLVLRDSSDIIQCIIDDKNKDFNKAEKLLIESSVEIFGDIYKESRAPTGFEVKIDKLNVIQYAEKFPITKDQSVEFLLDKRHLWLRSRRLTAILKIRSTVFGAVHEYFRSKEYYEFQSPSLTSGTAESGPTLFKVDYFNKPIYLTQTWQFYAEAAMFALEKIYCIAPSFRAEKSKTSRHLSEYWHAEVEVAWIDLDELIDIAEELIKHVIKKVLEKNKEELKLLNRDLKILENSLKKKFPRITYDEALNLLHKKNIKIPWGKDLRTIEEDKLMELFDTPVFVMFYPKEIMAFYKPSDKKNPKVARCFDALAPEGFGELIGGSERDTDIEALKESLRKSGEDVKNYEWFLDTRRYGSIPHAGFGMGVERLISWICKLDNIKDAIGFPRTMTRYYP